MSYSFSVKAATKAEALEQITAKLDEVVVGQPVHAEDRDLTLVTATAFMETLPSDATQDVVASLCGSIWKTDAGIKQLSLSVSVGLIDKG